MICLSCDIHHSSLKLSYNRYSDKSELQVTQQLIKLLEKYNVKATMFSTGKCFTEEWEDMRPISEHPLVEIGGHNYFCFKPELFHKVWNKAFNNFNGPWLVQHYDASKLINTVKDKTGVKIASWRNHRYKHGPNTDKILSRLGIKICSDEVSASATGPYSKNGIHHFPVNIIPDYDHIYHANRTEEWVNWYVNSGSKIDDFGPESYKIDEWTEIVLKQLQERIENKSIANILIHPITQYISDRFAGLEEILKFISTDENCKYSELPLE